MTAKGAWRGLLCPEDPAHGSVLLMAPDANGREQYLCPHSGHMPRPATHPEGKRADTRNVFTLDEVESGVVAELVAA